MKKILSLTLALIMILALFGCANNTPVVDDVSDAPQTESVGDGGSDVPQTAPVDLAKGATVACCMGSITHPVHRVVQYGFCTKAEELDMNPIISGLEEGSMQELINKWNSDISSNNAVGALIWTGDDSCYEMMKELKSQGISIVTAHFPHNYESTKDFIDICFVNSYEEYGKAAADFLVDRLIESGIEEGAIGWGGDGGGTFMGSSFYFTERIKELDTAYTLCDGWHEDADVEDNIRKMTEYIKTYPEMVGAYGIMHDAWVAAKEATGRDDLIVVARNYYPNISEALQSGAIAGAVDPLGYQIGEYSAQALGSLIGGEVFNQSEETWYCSLESPVVYFGGEGEQSSTALDELYAKAVEYFK